MGYSNNQSTPLRNIKGVGRVFGGTIPASTWKAFMTAALKDVPVTDFSQPAPIRAVADALDRNARGGFDPGDRAPYRRRRRRRALRDRATGAGRPAAGYDDHDARSATAVRVHQRRERFLFVVS